MEGLFGIGPLELMLVFFLALIFIGPGKMPEVAAQVGRAIREFQRASAELTEALSAEVAAAQAERAAAEAAAHVGENGHAGDAEAEDAEVVAQASSGEELAPIGDELAPIAFTSADEQVEDAAEAPSSLGPAEQAGAASEVVEAVETEESRSETAGDSHREVVDDPGVLYGLDPLPSALLAPSISANGKLPVVQAPPSKSVEAEPAGLATSVDGGERPIGAETPEDLSSREKLFGLDPLPSALLAPSEPAGRSGSVRAAATEGAAPTPSGEDPSGDAAEMGRAQTSVSAAEAGSPSAADGSAEDDARGTTPIGDEAVRIGAAVNNAVQAEV